MRQVIFWLVSFAVLYRIFTKDYNNGLSDMLYTFAFHIPLLVVVSINFYLVPRFIKDKQYLKYALLFLFLLITGIALHYFTFNHFTEWLLPGYYFIAIPSYLEIAQFIAVYLLVSFLLYFSESWFELRNRQVQLEKENMEVQLSHLKSQVNPHFLFNSLNNIYALTNQSNQKSNEYIIKLSDALRYVLYKTNDDQVKLKDEISYLSNYVELEKLRLEEHAEIIFETNALESNLDIAPLLLLPIIENCFKHCDKESPKIEIKIQLRENELSLNCVNNYMPNQAKNVEGGFGLKNLEKRLELLYRGIYTWDKQKKENLYISNLKIELNG